MDTAHFKNIKNILKICIIASLYWRGEWWQTRLFFFFFGYLKVRFIKNKSFNNFWVPLFNLGHRSRSAYNGPEGAVGFKWLAQGRTAVGAQTIVPQTKLWYLLSSVLPIWPQQLLLSNDRFKQGHSPHYTLDRRSCQPALYNASGAYVIHDLKLQYLIMKTEDAAGFYDSNLKSWSGCHSYNEKCFK